MQYTWMQPVSTEKNNDQFVITQLSQLKSALKLALQQRDWSLVCRIDRLSAQIIYSLGPKDKTIMRQAIKELMEIKIIYQQSLQVIDRELEALSNQAF